MNDAVVRAYYYPFSAYFPGHWNYFQDLNLGQLKLLMAQHDLLEMHWMCLLDGSSRQALICAELDAVIQQSGLLGKNLNTLYFTSIGFYIHVSHLFKTQEEH